MKNDITRKLIKLVAITFIFSLTVSAKPLENIQQSSKVEQLLKQAMLNYKRVADKVWVVKTKGKVLPEFDMLIAENENVVVVGVVMVNKKKLNLSPDLLLKLLKFNHTTDYVKVGIDDDDDLFVRAELNLNRLESDDLQSVFISVVTLADKVYSEIKPSLVTQ